MTTHTLEADFSRIELEPKVIQWEKIQLRYIIPVMVMAWLMFFMLLPAYHTTLFFSTVVGLNIGVWFWVWKVILKE